MQTARELLAATGSVLGVAGTVIALLVLGILVLIWAVVPFAVMSVKARFDQMEEGGGELVDELAAIGEFLSESHDRLGRVERRIDDLSAAVASLERRGPEVWSPPPRPSAPVRPVEPRRPRPGNKRSGARFPSRWW